MTEMHVLHSAPDFPHRGRLQSPPMLTGTILHSILLPSFLCLIPPFPYEGGLDLPNKLLVLESWSWVLLLEEPTPRQILSIALGSL